MIEAFVPAGYHQSLQRQGELVQYLAESRDPPQHSHCAGHDQDDRYLRFEPKLDVKILADGTQGEFEINGYAGNDNLVSGHPLIDQSLEHLFGTHKIEIRLRMYPLAMGSVVGDHCNQRGIKQSRALDVGDDAGHQRIGGDYQPGRALGHKIEYFLEAQVDEVLLHQGVQLLIIRRLIEISIKGRCVADRFGVREPGELVDCGADQFHEVDDLCLQIVLAESEGIGHCQRGLLVPAAVVG